MARALRRSAKDLGELAEEGDNYGNAVGIITVHAAIAYADALAIAYGGFKSAEGDHERAVDALKAALGARAQPDRVKELLSIIREKDAVSYRGLYYTVAEAKALVTRLDRFADWAEKVYVARP